MIYSYIIFLLSLIPHSNAETDLKTVEIKVNVPYWGANETIEIELKETDTFKHYSKKNIPAGAPVAFRVPPGRYLLRSKGKAFATQFLGPFQIYHSTMRKRLALDLEKGGSLTGLILDENGAPLEDVRVSVAEDLHFSKRSLYNPFLSEATRTANAHAMKSRVTTTGSDGIFSFKNVSTGKSYLHLEKPGYAISWDNIRITPDCRLQKEYQLKGAGPSVTMILKDDDGNTINNGWVYWLDPRRTITHAGCKQTINYPKCAGPSNGSGIIRIIDPPPESNDYWLVAQGYKWLETRASPGQSCMATLKKADSVVKVVARRMEDGSLIQNTDLTLRGLTYFDSPVTVTPMEDGSHLLRGDIETFPIFVTLHADGYIGKQSKYIWKGGKAISGFDALPLFDCGLYGEERDTFKDLETEPINNNELVMTMEKRDHSHTFTLHVIGEPGIPIDGIDVSCTFIDNKNKNNYMLEKRAGVIIEQTTPHEARVTVPNIGPGELHFYWFRGMKNYKTRGTMYTFDVEDEVQVESIKLKSK